MCWLKGWIAARLTTSHAMGRGACYFRAPPERLLSASLAAGSASDRVRAPTVWSIARTPIVECNGDGRSKTILNLSDRGAWVSVGVWAHLVWEAREHKTGEDRALGRERACKHQAVTAPTRTRHGQGDGALRPEPQV